MHAMLHHCRLHLCACGSVRSCYLDKTRRFGSARPVRPPVQAVPFAELADFYYYYFLCKHASMSLLYACACQGLAGCQCEHALRLLSGLSGIPHTCSAGTPSPGHGNQRDPGIPQLLWSPPGSSHPPVQDASLCSLLLLSCCWFPGRDLHWVSEQGWALGSPGRRGALARGRVEAGIKGVQCPITKTQGAGITLRSPCTAGTSTSRGRGSPHHCRRHTHFPAASQPFCSPSSIYLIINSAITINSWGFCSHVDQSSAVVRAEQGHVSSPEGLLSPGINCLGHVCCGCAGQDRDQWGLLSDPCGHGTGTGRCWYRGKTSLFAVFCSILQ